MAHKLVYIIALVHNEFRHAYSTVYITSEHLVLLSQDHGKEQLMIWMRDAGYGAGQARSEVRTLAADRSPSSQQPQVSVPLTHHHPTSRLLLDAMPSVVFQLASISGQMCHPQ